MSNFLFGKIPSHILQIFSDTIDILKTLIPILLCIIIIDLCEELKKDETAYKIQIMYLNTLKQNANTRYLRRKTACCCIFAMNYF